MTFFYRKKIKYTCTIRYLFCITARTVCVHANTRLVDKTSDVDYEDANDWMYFRF